MNHDRYNNERVLWAILATFGRPRSLLDIGSGDGTMVKLARASGIRALGVDLTAEPPDIRHDLRQPLTFTQHYDLILCLETAEHLPASAARTLCQTITAGRHPNTRLVFSAALPGQDGEGHVNCQPPAYWRAMLYEVGEWSYQAHGTAVLQAVLTWTAGPLAHWLVPNVQVF